MYVHTCGGRCSRRPAQLTMLMVATGMPCGIELYRPERSTTVCTSHRAHAMLHTYSPSRSLVHSTVASLWHAQLCHMEPVWGSGTCLGHGSGHEADVVVQRWARWAPCEWC